MSDDELSIQRNKKEMERNADIINIGILSHSFYEKHKELKEIEKELNEILAPIVKEYHKTKNKDGLRDLLDIIPQHGYTSIRFVFEKIYLLEEEEKNNK